MVWSWLSPPGVPMASSGSPSRNTMPRRQRVARAGAGADLVGALGVEPELLAARAEADAGPAQDDPAAGPAAARRGVEDVARRVDDRDVRRVLRPAGRRHERAVGVAGGHAVLDAGHPERPVGHVGVVRQRVAGPERDRGPRRVDLRRARLRVGRGEQPRGRHVDELGVGRSRCRGPRRPASSPRPRCAGSRGCCAPWPAGRTPPGC